jgi:hypothetical protein
MNLSSITKTANKKALGACFRLRNEFLENFILVKNSGEISERFTGGKSSICIVGKICSDCFVHNHPSSIIDGQKIVGGYVNIDDFFASIQNGIKKVFASTEDGFTSMDFSRSTVSKEKALKILAEHKKKFTENYSKIILSYNEGSLNIKEVKNLYDKLIDNMNIKLAKETGWIYSKVNWVD